MADPDDTQPRRSGISTTTLVSASIASAVATFVVSRIWGPGTLIGAAVTPVIVALVSEGVRRPAEQVRTTARRVVPVAAARPRPRSREHAPQEAERQAVDLDALAAQGPAPPGPDDIVVFEGPRRNYTVGPHPVVRHWRLAALTGLIAFAIVLIVYTVPDLIAGHSITGRGTSSTLFGGGHRHRTPSTTTTTTTTKTTTAPQTTTAPARTTTAPPVTVTQTVPAPATTPSPATTPTATTPAATTPAVTGGAAPPQP